MKSSMKILTAYSKCCVFTKQFSLCIFQPGNEFSYNFFVSNISITTNYAGSTNLNLFIYLITIIKIYN